MITRNGIAIAGIYHGSDAISALYHGADLVFRKKDRIGYTPGYRYADVSSLTNLSFAEIVPDSNYFITGFFAVPNDTDFKMEVRYGGIDFPRNGSRHCLVLYDESYTPYDYWDMTNADGPGFRVLNWKAPKKTFVRFVGHLPAIDDCYVKYTVTGEYLWKKGM